MIRKTFNIERKTIDAENGIYEAMISTESVDRDGDVIRAAGVDTSNYMRNPVVLFGHTYNDIDAVVGKTLSIETIPGQGIRARFQFATADVSQKADTVRKLWAGEFLNATSIGFIPDMASAKPNATKTGIEFGKSELLEFSIVPIPSNQDALRLAVKSMKAEAEHPGNARAWIRQLTADTEMGEQTVYACFDVHDIDIPAGATMLEFDEDGDCNEVPDPDAGKTRTIKNVSFHPPIAFEPQDEVYGIGGPSEPDEKFLTTDLFSIKDLSGVLLSLPMTKSFAKTNLAGFGINILTAKGIHRAVRMVKRKNKAASLLLTKRGRVLSASNEKTLREAQADLDAAKAKLDGVLSQLGDAPEEDTREASPQDVTLEAISETTETSALNVRELAKLFGDFKTNLQEVLHG